MLYASIMLNQTH